MVAPGGRLQRKRIAKRWAFSYTYIAPVRVISYISLLVCTFTGVLGFAFQNLFDFGVTVYEDLGKAPGRISSASAEEYWGGIVVVGMLYAVYLGTRYLIAPVWLRPTFRPPFENYYKHKGTLTQIERRTRAALILYRHASLCGRATLCRGMVKTSMAHQAKLAAPAEREIMRAWKSIRPGDGASAFSRHQKAELRRHAGRVVTLMRNQSSMIDGDPDLRLKELGSLLVGIGDRLAEARIGALVDEAELTGLEPTRDRETLKAVGAVLLITLVTAGVALLPVPTALAAPLTSMLGVLVLLLVFKGAARGAETVALLLGGK
ncbi:hypothetical protein [Streptomyces antibioticus]|uniref:hypothetical protein n=1 Tax=Streptomyces antibioticus TaxID=1890 RepID=UPI003F460708